MSNSKGAEGTAGREPTRCAGGESRGKGRKLFNALAAQQCPEITRSMDDAKNFDSTRVRKIKNERFFEAGYAKHSQSRELRMF